MEYGNWQWRGRIDLFGVPEEVRRLLLERWQAEALDGGGELEVAKAESDLYHTDRFELRASWSSLSRPFAELMVELAGAVPSGHPPMEVEGLLPATGQRMGVQVKDNAVSLIPYSLVRGPALAYRPAEQAVEPQHAAQAALA